MDKHDRERTSIQAMAAATEPKDNSSGVLAHENLMAVAQIALLQRLARGAAAVLRSDGNAAERSAGLTVEPKQVTVRDKGARHGRNRP